jgi:hypothetical protein
VTYRGFVPTKSRDVCFTLSTRTGPSGPNNSMRPLPVEATARWLSMVDMSTVLSPGSGEGNTARRVTSGDPMTAGAPPVEGTATS